MHFSLRYTVQNIMERIVVTGEALYGSQKVGQSMFVRKSQTPLGKKRGGTDSGNLWQRRPGWLDRGMGEVALEVIYSILHARDLLQ